MIPIIVKLIKQRRQREELYSKPDYWDGKATYYDDSAVSMWPNKNLNKLYNIEQQNTIQKYIGDVNGADVLDLGCGTGRFSRWLVQKGAQVTGTDFSIKSLEIAKKLSPGSNPTYKLESVLALKDHEAFDMVITMGVLTVACRNHAELIQAMTNIHRATRTGGRLILLEPIHKGFLHRVLNLDLPEFISIMKLAGFQILETKPLHFWPSRLVLAFVSWPMWFTSLIYRFGQVLMRLPLLKRLGDYHLIVAHVAAE